MEIQLQLTQWLGQLAGHLQLGYGFGAGMVSAVNPCGFAMLPAYLSLYLGAGEDNYSKKPLYIRMLRALMVSLVVTSGFALLFSLAGTIILLGGNFLTTLVPWIAVVIGAIFVFLGIWLLLGKHLSMGFLMRFADKVGDPRDMSIWGFFLFGLAFGITSMSCTLPIFLAVVGSSLTQGDFYDGFLQFVAYISGMGSVLLVLTLAIAVVKQGVVVDSMRKILPYIQKVSAVFLLTAGVYIIYYWFTSGLL